MGWLPKDRAERIGLIVSGTGHGALILWALLGGIFFTPDENPATIATEVSLMSSDDFAALQARAPTAATESPAQPTAPETSPKPPPAPRAEAPPEEASPREPEPEPQPDAVPDVEELSPVETDVTDAPPAETELPSPDSLSQIPDVTTANPRPKPAPTVAPVPSEDPSPSADTAAVAQEETTEAIAEDPVPEEPTEETAPQEAGEVLETEENQEVEVATAAPARSPRPQKRPETPAEPAPQETAATETPQDAAAAEGEAPEPSEDALAAALQEAMAGEVAEEPEAGTGVAESGPPLTGGEKDALVVAVKQCWNVGSLSTDALRTVVTVSVSMAPDGKPDSGSIRMIGYEGGDEASAQQAYEAGRRAIIRCAGDGYPLPAEKYEQWKEIEIVFNPEKMRLR